MGINEKQHQHPAPASNIQQTIMQIVKLAIVALLVCFFVAAVFGQGRGVQDYETAAAASDGMNEYHYNEIRQAVADHCSGQNRRGGKDIDLDIDIKNLEIAFEKNFFIVIKKKVGNNANSF